METLCHCIVHAGRLRAERESLGYSVHTPYKASQGVGSDNSLAHASSPKPAAPPKTTRSSVAVQNIQWGRGEGAKKYDRIRYLAIALHVLQY